MAFDDDGVSVTWKAELVLRLGALPRQLDVETAQAVWRATNSEAGLDALRRALTGLYRLDAASRELILERLERPRGPRLANS